MQKKNFGNKIPLFLILILWFIGICADNSSSDFVISCPEYNSSLQTTITSINNNHFIELCSTQLLHQNNSLLAFPASWRISQKPNAKVDLTLAVLSLQPQHTIQALTIFHSRQQSFFVPATDMISFIHLKDGKKPPNRYLL